MGLLLSRDADDTERERKHPALKQKYRDISLNAFHTTSIKYISPCLKQ